MDFLGLPIGNELMVLTDMHSRFPVTAEYVVQKLDEVLSLLCYPVEIASDNGPRFGEKFSEHLKHVGVRHRKSTPYYPYANGQAEAMLNPIKKTIRAAKIFLKKLTLSNDFKSLIGYYFEFFYK